MEWASQRLARQAHRVRVLRSRYDRLRARLNRSDGLGDIERLDEAVARRVARAEHLTSEIERLTAERERLEGEIVGCLTGAEALLTDMVDRFEAVEGHNWTPVPIVAYAAFTGADGALHDGVRRWRSPHVEPSCPTSRAGRPPHTICPGTCGVAALRSVEELDPGRFAGLFVVAAVELTGRVVEHEHGYRGERATAIAVVVSDHRRWFRTRDTDQLTALFSDPDGAFTRLSSPIGPQTVMAMELDLYLGTIRSSRAWP